MIVRTVIEILGAPREHVDKTLKMVVDKANSAFKIRDKKIYDAAEYKKLWSAFTELEIEFKDVNALIGFCFDYMPSSIEVLEPNEFNYKNMEFNGFVNDLLARLHKYDMILKNLKAENILLKKEKKV